MLTVDRVKQIEYLLISTTGSVSKYEPDITPYLDTFQAVIISLKEVKIIIWLCNRSHKINELLNFALDSESIASVLRILGHFTFG